MSQAKMGEGREHLPYLLVGTLFDEDQLDEQKGYFSRVHRDEKGSKKFHGAFTGGFVAGYNNTVGSELGWSSAGAMTASRDKPLATKSQSIMDFMDEEDLGPAKVGVNIVTSSQFDSFGQNHAGTANNMLGDRVFGIDTKDVLGGLGRTNAIGFQMLQRLKEDGRQPSNNQNLDIKPEAESESQTDLGKRSLESGLKEEKFYNFSLQASKTFKADYRGLGWDGSTLMSGEDQLEEEFNKHMKRLFNIQDEVNKPKNEPASGIAGKRIMFAASEDDYDGIGGGASQCRRV